MFGGGRPSGDGVPSGASTPGLLDGQVEHRFGDQMVGDYRSIDGREVWDGVIDVSAYVPRHVHQLADVLDGRVGRYVQVSSVSAYDPTRATVHEDAPLHPDPPADAEDVSALYGPLKAACERAAWARFGEVAVVRPAYVCGPYDPEDSFTYWVRRMADGGDIIVRDASAPMQIIDVRDPGRIPGPVCGHGGGRGIRRRRRPRTRPRRASWPRSPRRTSASGSSRWTPPSLATAGVTLPMMLATTPMTTSSRAVREPSPEPPDSRPGPPPKPPTRPGVGTRIGDAHR